MATPHGGSSGGGGGGGESGFGKAILGLTFVGWASIIYSTSFMAGCNRLLKKPVQPPLHYAASSVPTSAAVVLTTTTETNEVNHDIVAFAQTLKKDAPLEEVGQTTVVPISFESEEETIAGNPKAIIFGPRGVHIVESGRKGVAEEEVTTRVVAVPPLGQGSEKPNRFGYTGPSLEEQNALAEAKRNAEREERENRERTETVYNSRVITHDPHQYGTYGAYNEPYPTSSAGWYPAYNEVFGGTAYGIGRFGVRMRTDTPYALRRQAFGHHSDYAIVRENHHVYFNPNFTTGRYR